MNLPEPGAFSGPGNRTTSDPWRPLPAEPRIQPLESGFQGIQSSGRPETRTGVT